MASQITRVSIVYSTIQDSPMTGEFHKCFHLVASSWTFWRGITDCRNFSWNFIWIFSMLFNYWRTHILNKHSFRWWHGTESVTSHCQNQGSLPVQMMLNRLSVGFQNGVVSETTLSKMAGVTVRNLAALQVIKSKWKKMRQCKMTSSNGNIFRVTGHLCGEFTGPGEYPAQRPVTRSFDVFFDLHLNKGLSKQSWGWWFEMPYRPLWPHSNGTQPNLVTYLSVTRGGVSVHLASSPYFRDVAYSWFLPWWSDMQCNNICPKLDDVSVSSIRSRHRISDTKVFYGIGNIVPFAKIKYHRNSFGRLARCSETPLWIIPDKPPQDVAFSIQIVINYINAIDDDVTISSVAMESTRNMGLR